MPPKAATTAAPAGPTSQGDKKNWSAEEDKCLLELLAESRRGANAAANGFSGQQWTAVMNKFFEKFPNQAGTIPLAKFTAHEQQLKKKFKAMQEARMGDGTSGFGWNDTLFYVSAPLEVWDALKTQNPRKWEKLHPCKKPWPAYPQALALYADHIADGRFAACGGQDTAPTPEPEHRKRPAELALLSDSEDEDGNGGEEDGKGAGSSEAPGAAPLRRRDSDAVSTATTGSRTTFTGPSSTRNQTGARKGRRKGTEDVEAVGAIADVMAKALGAFVGQMAEDRKERKEERLAKRQRKMSALERAIEQAEGDGWTAEDLAVLMDIFQENAGVAMVYGITKDRDARRTYGRNKASDLKQVTLQSPTVPVVNVPIHPPFSFSPATQNMGGLGGPVAEVYAAGQTWDFTGYGEAGGGLENGQQGLVLGPYGGVGSTVGGTAGAPQ